MADEIATVGLSADATDFDATLNGVFDLLDKLGQTTAEVMKTSGVTLQTAVGGPLQTIADKVKSVTSGIAATTTSLAEKISGGARKVQNTASMLLDQTLDGMDAGLSGGQLFADLGTKIGAGVGGPAGSMIGKLIGEKLGDSIDLAGVLESVQNVADAVSDSFGGVGTFWDNTTQDMRDFFGDVRQGFKEFNIGALFSTDVDTAMETIGAFAGGILDGLTAKVELFVGRVANGMDNLWAAIREPFAKLADFMEKILVKIGILPEATGKWGESIRSVESIATEVFRAIGFGIGYLEGLFTKLGGYVTKYVISPLLSAIGSILEIVQDAFAMVAKNIGGAVGRAAKESEEGLKAFNDALKKQQATLDAFAARAKDVSILGSAQAEGDKYAAMLDGLKKKAAQTDEEIRKMRQAQLAWVEGQLGGIWAGVKERAQEAWDVLKLFGKDAAVPSLAATHLEGSAGALNAINQIRAGASPAEQLAKLQLAEAEKNRGVNEANGRKLDKLIDRFDEIEAV